MTELACLYSHLEAYILNEMSCSADDSECSLSFLAVKRTMTQRVRKYDDLLLQKMVTPRLRKRIEATKTIYQASLAFQYRQNSHMVTALTELDTIINEKWDTLYSTPEAIVVMHRDITHLRRFLALRIEVDYNPNYYIKHNASRFLISPAADAPYGSYGHYLQCPAAWPPKRARVSETVEQRHREIWARTQLLAEETLLDIPYVLEQLRTSLENGAQYECISQKFAREGQWEDLARKIARDRAHLRKIYVDEPVRSHRNHESPEWLRWSKRIDKFQNEFFEEEPTCPDGGLELKLTKKAIRMDWQRLHPGQDYYEHEAVHFDAAPGPSARQVSISRQGTVSSRNKEAPRKGWWSRFRGGLLGLNDSAVSSGDDPPAYETLDRTGNQ